MLGILKKEWGIFLKRYLFIILIAMSAAGLIGAGALKIIMTLDVESTYIYLGTFLAIMAAGGCMMIMVSQLVNTRFMLQVSFGAKRCDVIGSGIIVTILMTIISYAMTVIVYAAESKCYPIMYAASTLDKEFDFGILIKYGSLIYIFVAVLMWFICALGQKFGSKAFVIAYILFMTIMLGGPRLIHSTNAALNSFAKAVIDFFMSVTITGWVTSGIVACVAMLVIGYQMLKKCDIRF